MRSIACLRAFLADSLLAMNNGLLAGLKITIIPPSSRYVSQFVRARLFQSRLPIFVLNMVHPCTSACPTDTGSVDFLGELIFFIVNICDSQMSHKQISDSP